MIRSPTRTSSSRSRLSASLRGPSLIATPPVRGSIRNGNAAPRRGGRANPSAISVGLQPRLAGRLDRPSGGRRTGGDSLVGLQQGGLPVDLQDGRQTGGLGRS